MGFRRLEECDNCALKVLSEVYATGGLGLTAGRTFYRTSNREDAAHLNRENLKVSDGKAVLPTRVRGRPLKDGHKYYVENTRDKLDLQLWGLLEVKICALSIQFVLRTAEWFRLYLLPIVDSAKALIAEGSVADISFIIAESNNWVF